MPTEAQAACVPLLGGGHTAAGLAPALDANSAGHHAPTGWWRPQCARLLALGSALAALTTTAWCAGGDQRTDVELKPPKNGPLYNYIVAEATAQRELLDAGQAR